MNPQKMRDMWRLFEHNPLLPLGAIGQWDEICDSFWDKIDAREQAAQFESLS
jgi:hypothetical protein